MSHKVHKVYKAHEPYKPYELFYPLPTKVYINEDIPAKMKLSPVQMIMLNIPNRG